ncbi:DNA-binding protein [Leclercia adecarboxylata]|uniref:DNA-binding protein n=1 Tax=Leclercia adecarboxylata TaxID=83655 RepID=UPI00370C2C32
MCVQSKSNASLRLTEYQQNLLKRINNVAVSLMPEFEDKNQVLEALMLDDGSLLQLLCSIQMEQKTRTSEYEAPEVRRRRENLEAFYSSLQELGGVVKVNFVADTLGITRQAVNVRVKNNQLIAFKKNGDFIFPLFQFNDKGLVPGFEEIMRAFDDDTHPMLRLDLLKAPIQPGDGVSKSPIKIMQDGAKPEEMQLAIRAAKMLGSHIAS